MSSINRENTYALVTGGTSGIGLAFVNQLAAKAYNVCIVSIEEERLAEVKAEIEAKYSVKCITYHLDLAQENAAEKVNDFCTANHLHIEVLINNAGILIAENFVEVEQAKVRKLLSLHILTTTLLCHYLAKDMVAAKKGYILNVSSTSAFMPYPLISLYGPSKAYIRNFTRSIRNELFSENVHVSAILPGAVDTNLFHISTYYRKIAITSGIMHTPDYIAKRGLQIMFKNQGELVPGILNKLSLVFIKFVPDFVLRKLLKYVKSLK